MLQSRPDKLGVLAMWCQANHGVNDFVFPDCLNICCLIEKAKFTSAMFNAGARTGCQGVKLNVLLLC